MALHKRTWLATLTAMMAAAVLSATPAPARAQDGDNRRVRGREPQERARCHQCAWQKETGKKASISYAASPALAKQIEQGAPAQISSPADLDWMDYVAQQEPDQAGDRSNLLGNRIVLIAPKDKAQAIEIKPGFDLAKVLGDGRLAMANVDAVPAGKYGKAALEKLGVWASVAGKVAQAENVRAALLLVSRGEAPAGIVYQTDAAADPNVEIIGTFPEDTHPPIIYPIALTANATHPGRGGVPGLHQVGQGQAAVRGAGLHRARAPGSPKRGSGHRSRPHGELRVVRMDWMALSPEEWTAVRLSLRVASVATLVSLPFGIALRLVLARGRFWGISLLNGLVLLPLILPPVVTGYLLLILFGRRGPIGSFLADHFGIVLLVPLDGRGARRRRDGLPAAGARHPALHRGRRPRLEEAAGTLGANRPWVFLTVTLPLIVPGIIAGMILCFAKAMGEFGATITFVSNIPGETQTLPSAIYTFTQVPGGDAGALPPDRSSSIAIAMVALVASELMARRAEPPARYRMTLAVDIQPPARRLRARRALRGGQRARSRCSDDRARARPRSSTSSPA